MFGMEMLDVLIGLATIYMVFGIACTAAVEALASWFKVRSRNLESALKEFLAAEKSDQDAFVKAFYAHPMIQSLSLGEHGRPSYIPPETVGKVVHAVLLAGKAEKSLRKAVDHLPGSVESNRLKGLLNAIIEDVAEDATAFRKSIESHFNATMDRASGWFKRYTQNVALAVAAVLVLGGNVDTIAIASSLSADPEARAQLVQVAQQQLAVAGELKKQAKAAKKSGDELDAAIAQARTAGRTLAQAATQIETSGLQFGWKTFPMRWDEILQKLAGLLVSVVAISLGAPFWFSVLQRFMQVRGSGAAPEAKK